MQVLNTRRNVLALICSICWSSHAPRLRADDANEWTGKPVMVVEPTVELKAGTKVVGQARLGEILQVETVNGPWLWIKDRGGWIKQTNVVPADRAIEHFTAVLQRNPTAEAYHQRAIAHTAMRQYDRAVGDLDQAIERDRGNVALYNERGNALRKLGQLDRALADFGEVLQRNVRHPAVYTNRGLAWHDKGDYDRALADYNSAIRLDAKFAPAWEAAGSARQAKRDFRKAIANFKQAIELDPQFHLAHNNLAWVLATCPDDGLRDGEKAVEHATRACELTGFKDAVYLDTLAAAHAEAGQFVDAIRRTNEALERSPERDREPIAQRLKGYEAGRPYRELMQ